MVCMIDAMGKGISFLDYITDRPLILDTMSTFQRSAELTMALNSESCTSEGGAKQNCIAKIVDKLYRQNIRLYHPNIRSYVNTLNGIADVAASFYDGGEAMALANDFIPESDKELYSMEQNIKLRVGGTPIPFYDYIMSEMRDVLDGMDDTDFHRGYDNMSKVYETMLSKGQLIDLEEVDAVTARMAQFGRTKCETYVNYLRNVENNGYVTPEDYKKLLSTSRMLFSGGCMDKAVTFLKQTYIDGDQEIKDIIKTRFSPEDGECSDRPRSHRPYLQVQRGNVSPQHVSG